MSIKQLLNEYLRRRNELRYTLGDEKAEQIAISELIKVSAPGYAHGMIDITGQRFGSIVALGPAGSKKGHSLYWNCRCDCGNSVTVRGDRLRSKKVFMCTHEK